jgi:hypothetical protein
LGHVQTLHGQLCWPRSRRFPLVLRTKPEQQFNVQVQTVGLFLLFSQITLDFLFRTELTMTVPTTEESGYYFYRCTVHFEDTQNIMHKQMHNNGIFIILMCDFSQKLDALRDDDTQCAIETCRSSESVLM